MHIVTQKTIASVGFSGTDPSELIDAELIAKHILDEIDGVKSIQSDENGAATLTNGSGETLKFDVMVMGDWVSDNLTVAGWMWSVRDTEGQIIDAGGAPLENANNLDLLVNKIEDWGTKSWRTD